ncbi:DEKNAAC102890 [Brettanomyces naardenensis]|uniref:DEKNAAC102890 n=1 Tax=Brettanomyces naardenensis TaxID=13370 RepID=A0A448YLX8_BRENA|nr:DEKNAAC102890 [Brettanomyces naardenensis]
MSQGKLTLGKKRKVHRVTKRQRNPRSAAPKILKAKKIGHRELEIRKLSKKERGRFADSTEKSIAAKVGHLELLKGTRREIEKDAKVKK